MRTLRVPLNFKLITTLYQCANSMDSEKRNKSFGDMDSAFPRLNVFEIRRDLEFCPREDPL